MPTVQFESQTPMSVEPVRKGFLSKSKWYLTGGFALLAALISLGAAWRLGLFGPKQNSSQKQAPVSNQSNLTPNLKLTELDKEEFEKYWNELQAKKMNGSLGEFAAIYELFKNQEFVWDLKEGVSLSKTECEKLEVISNETSKYNFTEDHEQIMKSALKKCRPSEKEEVPEVPEEPGKTNDPNLADILHKTLKELLEKAETTIETVASNAKALASFKTLNKLGSAEERKKALGDNKTLAEAFENLLHAHLSSPSASSRVLLVYASKNSGYLDLSGEQIKKINETLVKLKPVTEIFAEATPGRRIDTSILSAVQVQDLTNEIKKSIKTEIEKVGQEGVKVTEQDLLKVLDNQGYLGYAEPLKFTGDVTALNAKYKRKLSSCDTQLDKAIAEVVKSQNKGDDYRKIYEVFIKEANESKRDELARQAIDILCSKAIIDQATEPTSSMNYYQSLCLAVSAHHLLRGELKKTGIAAGFPELENKLVIGINFFNNWKPTEIKEFYNLLGKVFSAYYQLIEALKPATPDSFFEKYSAFISNVYRFSNVLVHLYTGGNDQDRLMGMSHTRDTAKEFCRRIQRDKTFIAKFNALSLPENLKHLSVSGLNCKYWEFLDAVVKAKSKTDLELISKLIELSYTEPEFFIIYTQNRMQIVKSYCQFRLASLDLPEAIQKCLDFHFEGNKIVSSVWPKNFHDLIEAMKKSKVLKDAVKAFGLAVEKINDRGDYFIAAAKRVDMYEKFGITENDYLTKCKELMDSVFVDLSALFTSEEDKKFIEETIYGTNIPHDERTLRIINLLGIEILQKNQQLKVKVAMLFSLVQAYVLRHLQINDALAVDENSLDKLVSSEKSKQLISNAFALDYIHSNRENGELKTVTTSSEIVGIKKISWKRKNVRFSLFQMQIDQINKEMDEYAEKYNENDIILENVKGVECPYNKYFKLMEKDKGEFSRLFGSLFNWALKTAFSTKVESTLRDSVSKFDWYSYFY